MANKPLNIMAESIYVGTVTNQNCIHKEIGNIKYQKAHNHSLQNLVFLCPLTNLD